LLWRAARWQLVLFGLVVLVHGSLPTLLNLVSGVLVHAIPAAVAHGLGSDAGRLALVALAAFLCGHAIWAVAGNAMRPLSHILGSRLWLEVHRTCAHASLATRSLAAVEDQAFIAKLHAIQEAERRGVVGRTAMMTALVPGFRLVGGGALLLLFGFRWWAPFPLALAWYLANRVFLKAMERGLDVDISEGAVHQRRAEYLRSLVMEPAAAKEIRVFRLGEWMSLRYAEGWMRALQLMWRSRSGGWLAPVTTLVLVAAHAVVLGALAMAARAGELDAARLVVFVQAVMSSCALGLLGEPQWWLAQSQAMAERVNALQAQTATIATPRLAVIARPSAPPISQKVAVRFDNVRFTYAGRESPTLNGLTLDIPPGQSLAIVGVNGAGKSTLIKLLCGLYEPDTGRITVDGVSPLEAVNRIGVVFQDFVRYKLPLRENVAFGHLSLLRDQSVLDAALQDAGGDGLLAELPKGWDTVLSREFTNGVDLSGGEWQRVALARALTAIRGGAGLLILDEPTASLDVRAETELFERFLSLTRDVTTILVSHRLSSVRRASRIVVLDGGRMVEDGTHDELMRSGGHYATMFTLQASRFVEPVNDFPKEEVSYH
jgi:ATP-binding cassette, subfamily B, bacterial